MNRLAAWVTSSEARYTWTLRIVGAIIFGVAAYAAISLYRGR